MMNEKQRKNAKILMNALFKSQIIDPNLYIGAICVAAKEGLDMRRERGYKHTSVERVREIFGKKVKKLTDDQIRELKNDDLKWFNFLYNGRLGNRPDTNDGYRFRGGGPIQFTGRNMYFKYCPSGHNPIDIAYDPVAGCRATVKFLEVGFLKQALLTMRWGRPSTPKRGIQWIANLVAGLGYGKRSKVIKRACEEAEKYLPEAIDIYNSFWWGEYGEETETCQQ